MPHALAPLDIAIIVAYVIGTTLLGAYFTRGQRSVSTYFVGDRNVSWWLVLISIVTTETSAVTFLSVPGLSFNAAGGNMTFLQLALGYIVGRIVIAWLLLPQYLRGELFSAYQVLRQRFGPAVQRTASALFLVTRTIADGLRLYLAGLLLHSCTRWNMELSVIAMAGVTLAYTFLGGMKAVIWTDVVQFLLKIGGAVVAGAVMLTQMPEGWDTFVRVGEAADKFVVFDFAADPSTPFTFWAGVIGGAFFTMASHGADQMMVQRYLCSRSLGQARAALILSGFVVFLQFCLFLLIGIALFVLLQTGQMQLPEGTRTDKVFGWYIVNNLPVGLVGLVIAAVLAAAMSTLSSSLNSSATAIVADFYRPLWPQQDEKHYLRVARGLTIFWGIAQIGVALVAVELHDEKSSVVNSVLLVAGMTTGLVLGLFLLGSLRQLVSSRAALVGLISAAVTVGLIWLPSAFASSPDRWEQLTGWSTGPLQIWQRLSGLERPLAWPWYAPIGTVLTFLVALAFDGLTRRTPAQDADTSASAIK